MSAALFWLLLNIIFLIFNGFFSMAEMACVSFNRVRLQYYVTKKKQRAVWLNSLLHHPSRLFGTTLIGVNIATVVGSECGREMYAALGLSPDLSPLTQVIIVIIFGELAPMFAARHYAEHVALLCAPLLYFSAKLMTPFLWILQGISSLSNRLLSGKETEAKFYLTQEELKKILEEQEEEQFQGGESTEFNTITNQIFQLRNQDVSTILTPLDQTSHLPSNATVAQMQNLLWKTQANFVLIYNRRITNIVGIAYPRDLIKAPLNHRVRDYAKSAWFVTETTPLATILEQFRHNNESVAVILDPQGISKGIITLDTIIQAIFRQPHLEKESKSKRTAAHNMAINRSFPGEMLVKQFQKEMEIKLSDHSDWTLSQLMMHILDHHPAEGESVTVGNFELIAKETTLLGVKTVLIRSRIQ